MVVSDLLWLGKSLVGYVIFVVGGDGFVDVGVDFDCICVWVVVVLFEYMLFVVYVVLDEILIIVYGKIDCVVLLEL